MQQLREQLQEEKNMDFRDAVKRARQEYEKDQSDQMCFSYANILSRSSNEQDLRKSVALFTSILNKPKGAVEDLWSNAAYGASMSKYKLSEFRDSLNLLELVLAEHPKHHQALALKQLIEEDMGWQSMKGWGMGLAGVVGVAGIAGLALLKAKKK